MASVDYPKLFKAVEDSYARLEPFRRQRNEAIKQYVGYRYQQEGCEQEKPLGGLEQVITTYTQQLVGGQPRALVRANRPELSPTAADLEVALNWLVKKLNLYEALWEVVLNAHFGLGIAQVGMVEAEAAESWWHVLGRPAVNVIDQDDWVHDVRAKRWEHTYFMGHYYRWPFDVAEKFALFDSEARSQLKPTTGSFVARRSGIHTPETLVEPVEPQVELLDLWLPKHGLLLTLCPEQRLVLREAQWVGDRQGPYHLLYFNPVPGKLMPLTTAMTLGPLDELCDRVFRKLHEQAVAQKSVLPFRGGSDDDIRRLKEAANGDAFRCDGDLPQEVRYGGPDKVNLDFLMACVQLLSRRAGNLEQLAGLGIQATTLGQEQILQFNASLRISFMRQRVYDFVARIFRALAFYLLTDRLVQLHLIRPLPDIGMELPLVWDAERQQGDIEDYLIEVDVYSLHHRSAQAQLESILSLLNNFVGPLVPTLAQQGYQFRPERVLELISRYLGIPELHYLFEPGEPMPAQLPVAGAAQQASEMLGTEASQYRQTVPRVDVQDLVAR